MFRFSLFASIKSLIDDWPTDTPLRAVAIFGGLRLDLRRLTLDRPATVQALALFGGVEIIVPPDLAIVAGEQVCLFGGIGMPPATAEPIRSLLEIDALALFGAVRVKVRELPSERLSGFPESGTAPARNW